MKRLHLFGFLSVAVIGALTLGSGSAQAACTGPAGDEGKVIYNSDHKVVQFCNGTDWIGMAGGRSSAAGDTMVDGWPDVITCDGGTQNITLHLIAHYPSNTAHYRAISSPTDTQQILLYYAAGGVYSSNTGLTGYDCINKSIAQLYADGQAFNFIGGQGDNTGASVTEALKLEDADNNTIIQVEESSDENKIRFDTAGTERMIIDENGNVGIGTTSPASKLHIIESNGGILRTDIYSTGQSPRLILESDAANGSRSILSLRANGTEYGALYSDYSTSAARANVYLRSFASDGDIGFVTNDGGTTNWDHMVLDGATGNVGIGTTAPVSVVHVRGGASANDSVQSWGASGSSGAYSTLELLKIADTSGDFLFRTFHAGAAQAGKIGFGSYDGGTPWNGAQMVLDSATGNVGIGTADPSYKLNVAGGTTSILSTTTDYDSGTTGSAVSLVTGTSTGETYGAIQAYKTGGTVFSDLVLQSGGGNVGIGTTAPGSRLHVVETKTDTTAGAKYMSENVLTAAPSAASSSTFSGQRSALLSSGANSIAAAYGAHNEVRHQGTGSIATIRGVSNLGIIENATATATNVFGGQNYALNNVDATVTNLYGVNNLAVNGEAGAVTNIRGANNTARNDDAVGVPAAYGLVSAVQQSGATGSISSAFGLYSAVQATSGAAASQIGTGYGLYIQDIQATTDYGVYQASADDTNYFAGNVGIGTSPQNPLHVSGNGGTMNLEGTDHTYIQFYPDTYAGGRKGYLGYGDGANNHFHLSNNESDGDIIFANNGGGRLYIKPSGDVGIGTITPSDGSGSGGQVLKLDVAGAVGATHYCDADGLNCTAAAALGGTADNLGAGGTTTGNMTMNNASPTLFLQDTDHHTGMIHMNSNVMHFLSGSGVNGGSWAINGSAWPMTINMTNDAITIGGDMTFGEGTLFPRYMTLQAQDGTNEGGEIQLRGAGSYADVQIDNYQGNTRIHTLAAGKQFQVLGGDGVEATALELTGVTGAAAPTGGSGGGASFGGSYEYYRSGNTSCSGAPAGHTTSGNPLNGNAHSCPSGYSEYIALQTYDSSNTNCLVMCYK